MNRIAPLLTLSVLAAALAPGPAAAADLPATAALIAVGTHGTEFSVRDALASMAGYAWTDRELVSLGERFGNDAVAQWEDMTAFALDDIAAKAAGEGVALPTPPKALSGRGLAKALVALGTAPNRTFRAAAMIGALIPAAVSGTLRSDLAQRFDAGDDRTFDRITGQAMVDLAREVGAPKVTLAVPPPGRPHG